MAPIYVKGGIWTNVEDEILKLSISKYGLNQWSRVSSLLAKKTAKQCKARWNEWLDPNIRKIEWSKDEDEKLLRMVKLIPNQWRTIAPIVGRTLTQCIDRYQQLLDEANNETAGDNEFGLQGPGIESVAAVGSKVQVGDLHLNPESKPARPDAVEMDDEEKEMLSEARARLANTQGKKAKRKARERMLDETRRISLLQKRRELKNAGINMKLKKKKKDDDKHIDYSAEIPVYQKPLIGFYDTTEEAKRNINEQKSFEANVRKNGTKNLEFEKQVKRDKRNRDVQTTVEKEEILKSDELKDIKRRKLVMPEPLNVQLPITYEEIAEEEDEERDVYLAKGLLNDKPSPKIEKHTESQRSRILVEARALKLRSELQSSLIAVTTTNEENENTQQEDEDDFDNYVDEFASELEFDVKSKLASLPAPKNDNYDDEMMVSDEDIVVEEPVEDDSTKQQIIDQGELLRLEKLEEEEKLQKALLRRSQLLQRALPIPKLDKDFEIVNETGDEIGKLIDQEMVSLIKSDYCKLEKDSNNEMGIFPDLDEDSYNLVQKLLKDELSNINNENGSSLSPNKILSILPTPDGLPGLLDFETPSNGQIQSLINDLKTTSAKSAKLERKFLLLNGGYVKRYESLILKNHELEKAILETDLQLKTYKEIETLESIAIDNRTSSLQESVDVLVSAENVGQRRYEELARI